MRIYLKISAVLGGVLFLFSCSNNFVENEPYTEKVEENFYETPDDAFEGVVAIYDALQRNDYAFSLVTSEIASDNCFGGYGTADNQEALEWDRFQFNSNQEINNAVWENNYLGIYRANVLLENIDNIEWEKDDERKERYQAEARFLRAFFHFRLARFFGDIVPLDHTLTQDEFESPRAPAKETYSLIAEDLKYALENLPDDNYSSSNSKDFGRVTKWAAEGILAKIFLFYTDYYSEGDLAGVVTKEEARQYIRDLVENSGHELLKDFSHLWLAASLEDYAGEANNEVIWSIRFNGSGDGNYDLHEGNRWVVHIAPRGSNIGPYAQGWGGGPVNPKLYEAYEKGDTRRDATIINFEAEGLDFDPDDRGQRQYTGYAWKKYVPITNSEGEGVVAANGGDFQIDNYIDQYVLRFSDALLMAAELNLDGDTGFAQECLNRVRSRAFGDNNHNVNVNKENIMEERRLELALEGDRYFDLIRQGMDVAKSAIDNSEGGSEFGVDFRTETNGWFPLPESQIRLSNGAIEQNPGW